MAPRTDMSSAVDAVLDRRQMAMNLRRRGYYAWQIAHELRISRRTVQRYIADERAGRPPGRPLSPETHALIKQIAIMREQGLLQKEIGRRLGKTSRAIRHYVRRYLS
jgi:DNA-binding NarL/FixJ family response regulator